MDKVNEILTKIENNLTEMSEKMQRQFDEISEMIRCDAEIKGNEIDG